MFSLGIRFLWVTFALGAAQVTVAAESSPKKITVDIAAASDLKFALDEVVAEFKVAKPNVDVKVTYGSSGSFFAQIFNKAPFDIFFSADIDYPRRLIAAGIALKESEFVYAIGQIVLWVPNGSKIDIVKDGIDSVKRATVKKIAIANPTHAPYGRAAEAAMRSLGVYDAVKHKIVLGENISQTAQFVESGAADIGFIALSLALSPAMKTHGTFWPVPVDSYQSLVQGGAIMATAKNIEATKMFRDFVLGETGKSVLKRFGFFQPGV